MNAFHRVMARRTAGVALLATGVLMGVAAVATTAIDQEVDIQRTGANQYTVSWNAFLSQGDQSFVAAINSIGNRG